MKPQLDSRWFVDRIDMEPDDGYDPPTDEALSTMCGVCADLRPVTGPRYRVVSDGAGGVCFSRRRGERVEKVHVWEDGDAEWVVLCNTKVTERRPFFSIQETG